MIWDIIIYGLAAIGAIVVLAYPVLLLLASWAAHDDTDDLWPRL